MMMLRSVINYDSEASSWKIPHREEAMSSLKADILKLARGSVYEEHQRFILTFEPKWRQDENIILIMCAIILFTHDRPKTIHSDVIKLEQVREREEIWWNRRSEGYNLSFILFSQNSYYYLLRRYLESVYSGCEAKSTFMRLIKKVHELRKFNEAVISVYLDVNPAEVEPLLIEIFDLKNQ